MNQTPAVPRTPSSPVSGLSEREVLLTLFDLGRQVASVIDFDELLQRIPDLIGRLIQFDAFAVYLLDEKRSALRIAYAVGYPETGGIKLELSQGLVGRVIASQQASVLGDIRTDPGYFEVVPGMASTVAVPLVHKAKSIGALNVLSRARDRYSDRDANILRQFASHVATALVNARLFERERHDADAFETLAEIGREVAAVLDLDQLLARVAQLTKRVIDYRTFGILLLNEPTQELEMSVAVQYGEKVELPKVPLGEGLVGYAALHREAVLVPDVSKDPRYIKVVDDVRSELAIPMLLKDRCIGVFDLESPELDAFSKRDVEILTLLASQAAVAIENARLYEEVRRNEERIEKELRFAQRVQMALLPTELPRALEEADVAARFEPARELGGDLYDFLMPDPTVLAVAVGDVSGKGAPAALYGGFVAELVRSRTMRRRFSPELFRVSGVLQAMNMILHERQLEEYYCTLCYAFFDFPRRVVTLANSGLPYPIYCSGDECSQIELPGVPLGSFAGVTYDEIELQLQPNDLLVFCTDGIFESSNERGSEFGARRACEVVARHRNDPARVIVDAMFDAVMEFRGGAAQGDDMTVVAVRVRG
jgi:sigma-B regulation protein RsbU (phosphoserine phosphatase)